MARIVFDLPTDISAFNFIALNQAETSFDTTKIVCVNTHGETVIFGGYFHVGETGEGDSVGGSLESIEYLYDGQRYYTMTDLSLPAADIYGLIYTGTAQAVIDKLFWSDDSFVGSSGGDVLTARAGNDVMDGGGGEDVLYGNLGDDVLFDGPRDTTADALFGGQGNDTVTGTGGSDAIYGNLGDDLLACAEEPAALYGGQGDDTITGSIGNDTLFGNLGNDLLKGGAGANTYVFAGTPGDDVIESYQLHLDRIDLRAGQAIQSVTVTETGTVVGLIGGTITLVGVAAPDIAADIV